VKVNGIKLVCL